MVFPKVLRVELLNVTPLATVILSAKLVPPLTTNVLMEGFPPVLDQTLAETITSSLIPGKAVA